MTDQHDPALPPGASAGYLRRPPAWPHGPLPRNVDEDPFEILARRLLRKSDAPLLLREHADAVQQAACRAVGVEHADFLQALERGAVRIEHAAGAAAAVIALVLTQRGWPSADVGAVLGRERSTISPLLRRAADRYLRDAGFRDAIARTARDRAVKKIPNGPL